MSIVTQRLLVAHVHVQCVKRKILDAFECASCLCFCYFIVKAKGLLVVSEEVLRNKYAHVKDGQVCRGTPLDFSTYR
jgi:hypothetical protein